MELELEEATSARQFVVACRPMAEPIPSPKRITGVIMRPYEPFKDDPGAVHVYNMAFAGQWNYTDQKLAAWQQKMQSPYGRPELCWVAEPVEALGRIVGMCIVTAPNDEPPCGCREAWVDILATAPTWQGRGIGRALLMHGLRSIKEAGYTYAVLGVDSECEPTVRDLYMSAGFRVPQGIGRPDCGRKHCWCASAGVFVSS